MLQELINESWPDYVVLQLACLEAKHCKASGYTCITRIKALRVAFLKVHEDSYGNTFGHVFRDEGNLNILQKLEKLDRVRTIKASPRGTDSIAVVDVLRGPSHVTGGKEPMSCPTDTSGSSRGR